MKENEKNVLEQIKIKLNHHQCGSIFFVPFLKYFQGLIDKYREFRKKKIMILVKNRTKCEKKLKKVYDVKIGRIIIEIE